MSGAWAGRLATALLALAALGAGALLRPGRLHGGDLPAAMVVTQVPRGQARPGAGPRAALDQRYPAGSRVVLLPTGGDGPPQLLSAGLEAAGAPRVSADGNRIVFAGRPAAGARWAIYSVRRDGSGLRPVAQRDADCGDPGFLAHDRLVFACSPPAPAGAARDSQLYVTGPDGAIEAITFGPRPAFDPTPLADGRILFTRGEPGGASGSGLFTVNPDGTQLGPFARGRPGSIDLRPRQTTDGGVVLLSAGSDAIPHPVRLEMRLPGGTRRDLASDAAAGLAAVAIEPLAAGGYLVALAGPEGGFGISTLTASTPARLTPRFDSREWDEVEAVDAAPMPTLAPRGRPSSVKPGPGRGQLLCYDVNRSESPLPSGSSGELRVSGIDGEIGRGPIEADGSFAIDLPADRPLRLATYTAAGVPIATCDWIWLRPGEVHACFGCHESPSAAPVNRRIAALARPPTSLGAAEEKP